jgi:hypothetical protein
LAPNSTYAPPAWWRSAPSRQSWPYCCYGFSSSVSAESVFELTSKAVCASPSWHAEVAPANDVGVAVWRRGDSEAVLSLVVAGLHPLIVVAGAGGVAEHERGGVSFLAAWPVKGAMRRFAQAAREAGGREVATGALPELVRVAGERLNWRIGAEHSLEDLAQRQRFRACPRCGNASEAGTRWCTRCDYEFTGSDDHAHDVQNARFRQEAEGLRQNLARIQADEFPPFPMGTPPVRSLR